MELVEFTKKLCSPVDMTYSYIAYIDESGDDGLNPANFRRAGQHGGSSHWLTVSAMVARYKWHNHAVSWRNEILTTTRKNTRDLHFANLSHGQRLAAAQLLSTKPIRAISVLSNKTTIPTGSYNCPSELYFYLTRYVIERVSWICKSHRRFGEGDGRVKIVFSRRGSLSYDDFRDYLRRLQSQQTSIYWPAIDINGIDAQDHSRLAGLQLADIIASSMASGLEANEYGNCESRYAEVLKPITYYATSKNYFSYGVKLVPNLSQQTLTAEQTRFINIFK